MFVKSIRVEKKKFNLSKLSGETQKLLPDIDVCTPNYVEITLDSMHIGIANGLRRVISDEVPVKAMNVTLPNINTNDVFIVKDFVQSRLRQIPLLQNVPPELKLQLEISNTTPGIIEVTAADLTVKSSSGNVKISRPGDIMYDTFVLTELNPERFISIKDIFIDVGYNWQYGGYKIATNVALVPLDQQPFDPYENNINDKSIKAALADPRKHRLTFHTTGNIDIKELLILACEEIIIRLERFIKEVQNNFHTVESPVFDAGLRPVITTSKEENKNKKDYRKLGYIKIENENDTIGEMIKRTVNDLFSDIKIITGITDPVEHSLKIQIEAANVSSDGSEELKIAASECIKQFKKIKDEFKAAKIT